MAESAIKSDANACYVKAFLENNNHASESVLSIIKSNWQYSIMALLGSAKDGMYYNDILYISGLNPKTLSSVLKKLTANGMVLKSITDEGTVRTKYILSKQGLKIISIECPIMLIRQNSNITNYVKSRIM